MEVALRDETVYEFIVYGLQARCFLICVKEPERRLLPSLLY